MFPDLPMWLDVPLTYIIYVVGMALTMAACLLGTAIVALIACIPGGIMMYLEDRRFERQCRGYHTSRNADGGSS